MPRFSWVSLGVSITAASLVIAPLGAFAQSAPAASVHVVQDGETLSQIALDANTDVASIVSLNGLNDANALAVGQSLKLPSGSGSASGSVAASAGSSAAGSAPARGSAGSAPAATPAPAARGGTTYTVADGDTLWDIAQRFGTTTDALLQLNHLDDAGRLSLGMTLTLPSGATASTAATATPARAAAAPAPAPTSSSSSGSAAAVSTSGRNLLVSYTVQPGENLTKIAHQFNVSADAIVKATGLDDANKLAVGSVVKVPVPAREHQVAEGETLRDIAATEKVDLGSLIDFNQIDDPELIRVGQVVLLPVAATGPQQASANSSSQSVASTGGSSGSSSASSSNAAAAATSAAPPASASRGTSSTSTASAPATSDSSASSAGSSPAGSSSTSDASASSGQSAAAVPPTSMPTPTPSPTPKPSPSATASPKPSATPKAVAPVAVVAPPPGAPTDGLAGAGLKFLGSPYVWGGSSPSGFDCSGFVWYVARQMGKPLSRGLFAQYAAGPHPGRDQLQVGDLVFFQNTFTPGLSHNGIYIGNGQFVHAADENAGVTISSLGTAYWTSHWFGATRLP